MKNGIAIAVVSGFALALVTGSAHADSACNASSKVGAQCTCKVLELRPTQMAVGMIEVKERERDLSTKKPKKLDAYLHSHPEPAVKGPGGALYITDHHHFARALADLKIETTYCKIEEDYSNLTSGPFWDQMKLKQWVFLNDENGGGPHDPKDLPTSVEGLKDDPYRSLAGEVERTGGVKKPNDAPPFFEFIWADFFRPQIKIDDKNFEGAVDSACTLAISDTARARKLPGYTGGPCRPATSRDRR